MAFVVLLDGEFLVARVRRLVPARHRPQADWIGRTFYKVLAKYFAGSLLVAVLAGVYILAIGLILRVPLAPLAAVWMMVTDLIPQVGGFLGGAVFVLLGVTASPLTGVICLVLYVLYMNFENHILQPAIVGDAVNLSPPTTMLAALVGAAALGVPGAIVGTPIAGTAKGLYMEFRYGRVNLDDLIPTLEAVAEERRREAARARGSGRGCCACGRRRSARTRSAASRPRQVGRAARPSRRLAASASCSRHTTIGTAQISHSAIQQRSSS